MSAIKNKLDVNLFFRNVAEYSRRHSLQISKLSNNEKKSHIAKIMEAHENSLKQKEQENLMFSREFDIVSQRLMQNPSFKCLGDAEYLKKSMTPNLLAEVSQPTEAQRIGDDVLRLKIFENPELCSLLADAAAVTRSQIASKFDAKSPSVDPTHVSARLGTISITEVAPIGAAFATAFLPIFAAAQPLVVGTKRNESAAMDKFLAQAMSDLLGLSKVEPEEETSNGDIATENVRAVLDVIRDTSVGFRFDRQAFVKSLRAQQAALAKKDADAPSAPPQPDMLPEFAPFLMAVPQGSLVNLAVALGVDGANSAETASPAKTQTMVCVPNVTGVASAIAEGMAPGEGLIFSAKRRKLVTRLPTANCKETGANFGDVESTLILGGASTEAEAMLRSKAWEGYIKHVVAGN